MKKTNKKTPSVLTICLALILATVVSFFVISILHDKYGYFEDETPLVEDGEEINNKKATSLM